MKKVYISLPMAGHEDTVYERYTKAVDEVKQLYPKCKILGPVNIESFSENGLDVPRTHKYEWYIIHDLKTVMKADAIYLTKGYNESRGCRMELCVANELGKEIIKQKEED